VTWKPKDDEIDAELEELGVAATRDTRTLMSLLATDPHALYTSLSRLSELDVPDNAQIPSVDALVNERMPVLFRHSTEPQLLHKGKAMGGQCKRLLGVLIRDIGTPVPLPELLLANGLRSATPRRLRELETEHGAFEIRTFAKDRLQHYVLVHPEPDLDRCARYWLRSNIRNSRLPPSRRVLAVLSAEITAVVSHRDLDYVLPEDDAVAPGRARETSGLAADAIAELRKRGYRIEQDADGYRLCGLTG